MGVALRSLCHGSASHSSAFNIADSVNARLRTQRLGRPAALARAERAELVRRLKAGALAAGFATELWTLNRVGELIARRFKTRLRDRLRR
jgi:transposase